MDVTLQAITIGNFEAVMDLELPAEQACYVSSNAYSIAQSHYYPGWRPRAICCDGVVAGFALYSIAPRHQAGEYAIYRLMVDHARQRQGIGRRALALLLAEIRAHGDAHLVTICYHPDNAVARRLYATFGFEETQLDEWGEMIAQIRAWQPGTGPALPGCAHSCHDGAAFTPPKHP